MGTNTPNLGLYKPTRGELGWDDEINANFDTIDTQVDRLNDEALNVKAYGAVGDGATDDTAAVQAAIDAVKTAGGGTVFFPATTGGYKVTATLDIGDPYGSSAGTESGIRLVGGMGTPSAYAASVAQAALIWGGASGGGPILLVRQVQGLVVDGLLFDGANLADYPVVIRHVTGDVGSPHMTVFRHCVFQRGKVYNVLMGADSLGSGHDGDTAACKFDHCYFTTKPGGVTGSTTVANFRGTSANALPVSFANCEFVGDRLVTEYQVSVTGGSYDFYGCLSSGAITAAFFLGSEGAKVPPNINVFGMEVQGDAALLRTSAGGSSAAPQRASSFNGVFQGSDGGLTLHADAVQWGFGTHTSLGLNNVRLSGNLNVTSASSIVFVNGLQFTDAASQGVTGQTQVIAGFWYDATAASSPKYFGQAAYGFAPGSGPTGNRAAVGTVPVGTMWYDTTLDQPIFSNGTIWTNALGGKASASNPWVDVTMYGATGDGSTDDTAAIQAAYAAAGIGGTVFFPRADYLITATLVPLDAQHWVFGGHSHWSNTTNPYVRLKYTGTGTAISLSGASGVKFSGMRLDCTNNTSTVIGVSLVDPAHWCVFDACTFRGPAMGTGVAVKLTGQTTANAFHSFRDCSFYQWSEGLRLSGFGNSNRFDMTTFHSCTTAIAIGASSPDTQGGENNLFTMIELDSSCTTGITIANTARRNTFMRVSDDGVTTALTIASGITDTSFYNCHFVGTITDSTSGFETFYWNCSGTEPGSNAAMDIRDAYLEIGETSAPAAPGANRARIYVRDNGSGKTQVVVRFNTGATQVMATEP